MYAVGNAMKGAVRAAALMVLAVCAAGAALAQEKPNSPEAVLYPDGSPAAQQFLQAVNSATEEALRRMPGMTPDVVARVMEQRKAGKRFTNILQFRRATHITPVHMDEALAPYLDKELQIQAESQRRPVTPPAQPGKAAGRQLAGGKPGEPASPAAPAPPGAPHGSGPVGNVRPGFYGKLPGYENLDQIDPIKKKEFLELINREMCTCGCQGETLAFCLVNDPACAVVKARVRKVYEDVVGSPPR